MRLLDPEWNPPGLGEEEDPHAGAPVLAGGESLADASTVAVLVHGRGGSGRGMLAFGEDQLDQQGIAFVAPEASGQSWYPASFMAPLERNEPWLTSALGVLDRIAERLKENGFRSHDVLWAGFSQGACLALEYVLRRGGRRRGVVGMSGGLIGPEGHRWTEARAQEGTPIFLGCSDVDPHIPVERVHETTRVLERHGARVTERIYPGMGHTVNDDEVGELRKLLSGL